MAAYSVRQESVVEKALTAAGEDSPEGWRLPRLARWLSPMLAGLTLVCCCCLALSVAAGHGLKSCSEERQARDLEMYFPAPDELGPEDEELPLLPLLAYE